MGRIEELLKKGGGTDVVQCAGAFPQSEADRLTAAWRHSGAKTRADFIYNATMDAVEKVEQLKGGMDALAKIEADRVKKAEEARAKAAQKGNATAAKK
jgi:hypothetical protein